jgi:hypothetical protein
MNPLLPPREFRAYTVRTVSPGRVEVTGWLTESIARIILGYPPHVPGELVAVGTSLESARATLPSELGRVVTTDPKVEIWTRCTCCRSYMSTRWLLSSSSDRRALDVVDGTGKHVGKGAHYSRRTPGSRTFTGVGQEIVLVTEDGNAVWAVVRQRTPHKPGSGASRGRQGTTDSAPKYVWRNMLFRNLGPDLSSELIRAALETTYIEWRKRYGGLPPEPLRTEVDTRRIRSTTPGCCYKKAGWLVDRLVRGKLYLLAPPPQDV